MASNVDKQVDLAIDYKAVFGSEEGERVLFDLMKNNFMLAPTFTSCVHEMALREGSRNAILRILSILKVKPEELRKPITKGMDIGITHIGIGLINNKLVCGDITEIGSFQNHSYKPNCINKVIDDKRISYVRTDKLGNAGIVRNTQLDKVKSKWIAMLDDDDTLKDTYVESLK